jgi:hypothetical protein
MRRFSAGILLFSAFLPAALCSAARDTGSGKQVFHGWISDEQCARGRAEGSDGVYTGTNPGCAKECVAKGKKVVFVDPDKKKIFVITNPEAAKAHIGDYVEIKGALDNQTTKLQIDSIKMLEKGSATCAVKPKKKT